MPKSSDTKKRYSLQMKGIKKYPIILFKLFKEAAIEFNDDKAMKLSASLAYYTIFALSPLLIVIISLCGIFLGRDAIEGKLYMHMHTLVGDGAALQIQGMIKQVTLSGSSVMATVIGIVTLLIGATGLFSEIQSSINIIWGVELNPDTGIKKILINRLLAFLVILALGLLLIVTLIISGLLATFDSKISQYLPGPTINLLYVINYAFSFLVITSLFAIIFKALPDAVMRWKDVYVGAIATAILFMIGKYFITLYLGQKNVSVIYGAAGSLIVILLWVYYSAIILYFGAEFTEVYARFHGMKITPNKYARLTDAEHKKHALHNTIQKEEEARIKKIRIENEVK
jgi:membrane protein